MKHNEPLYRKVNRRCLHCYETKGGKYGWQRHTKNEKFLADEEIRHGKMKKRADGFATSAYDYTPLFKYLLNCIGEDVDVVYHKIHKRIKDRYPFDTMVSRKPKEELRDTFRWGECTYFSQLYVDENNKIQKVNPSLSNMEAHYGMEWGQTLNGNAISLKGINSGSKSLREEKSKED